MKTFTAIIERDIDTNLHVGYVPEFPGTHSQGETLDELQDNLREVIEMLLEDDKMLGFAYATPNLRQFNLSSDSKLGVMKNILVSI